MAKVEACDPCHANGAVAVGTDEIVFRGKRYVLCKPHGDGLEKEFEQVFTKPKNAYKSA
ncbi:hypothetical protein SMD44_07353 [Streptomyces alboflavus]|uniref:Uncharacterized protein n=1 Tax=Streptomyces alboflavus TaxID=67267 RepID=A0A1Z1WN52_9ACTN|nr:hypothetical protein [Streptomyces alboflavus]ARX87871.1 hypothetical protein SMD44_07353 [Streptomyces alboflavus]